jgi:hypothetical protein
MNVPKLGNEARMIAHIVIKVARLPERLSSRISPAFLSGRDRHGSFEELHGLGKHFAWRFADEQVDMFRHDNVAEDIEHKAATHLLKGAEKRVFHLQLRE